MSRVRPREDQERLRRTRRGREGRKTVTVDFERKTIALGQLLTLGPGVEVVEPEPLRAALREIGSNLRTLYS